MRKLRLSLEDISVDSFPTHALGRRPGTVAGHGNSDTTCFEIICGCPTGSGHTCDGQQTCVGSCDSCPDSCGCPPTGGASCGYTCDPTCPDTCWHTCAGDTCPPCTHVGQIICDP
jgi:hypothetical protein